MNLRLIALFSGLVLLAGCGSGGGGGGSSGGTSSPPTSPVQATSLLQDAGWSLNPSGRQLTTISWVNRNGVTVQSSAYSGEIEIIVDPTKMFASDVQTLVSQFGGTFFAELPVAGLYWVNVSAGSEASAIAALRGTVIDAFPVLATTSKQDEEPMLPLNYDASTATANPIPVTGGNLVLDNFTTPMCVHSCPDKNGTPDPAGPAVYVRKNSDGTIPVDSNGNFKETTDKTQAASHGNIVNYYRTNHGTLGVAGGSTINVFNNPSIADETLGIASLIKGAVDSGLPGRNPVINYSRGPFEYTPNDTTLTQKQRTNWEVYNRNTAGNNYEGFSAVLNANVAGTTNTIIVQAAGNSATDLTPVLVEQQTLHPTAASQIIQVGALDSTGNIAEYSNYSTASGTVIYVPVTDVTNNGNPVQGTSFAAPQVQYLVNQIRANRPDLTPAQIRQVLFNPSVAPPTTVQAPIGQTITVPVINNPYAILQTAISVANRLFPKTNFTLTINTAGTGSGTVTANPPGPSYPAGTVVTLTANPASGSTFTGWSGACSGTGSCVMTMNANQTVTASFLQASGWVCDPFAPVNACGSCNSDADCGTGFSANCGIGSKVFNHVCGVP